MPCGYHKKKHKYKKKIQRYAKKGKRAVDAGVRIWNRLNTSQNRKAMSKLGKKANRMQENILNVL